MDYKVLLKDTAREGAKHFEKYYPNASDDEIKDYIEEQSQRFSYLLKIFISLEKGQDFSFEGIRSPLQCYIRHSPYGDE